MEDCFTRTDMDMMHDELRAQGSLVIYLGLILCDPDTIEIL